jgi:hypothetical protein
VLTGLWAGQFRCQCFNTWWEEEIFIFSSLGSFQAFYSVGFFWVTPGGGGGGGGGGLRSLFLAHHNTIISKSQNLAV